MKLRKTVYARALVVLLCFSFFFFTGCTLSGQDSKVVFSTGFDKDELFKIGTYVCTRQEFMIYLTNTQNRYEEVYGPEIWNVKMEKGTLEENIKQSVLARLAQIKTMNLLARQKNITLTDIQKNYIMQNAKAYYSSLTPYEIEKLEVTVDGIVQMYTEYALANLVYEQIIETVNPEISDDEARIITVEHLFLKTYGISETGERKEYSDTLKGNCLDKMATLRKRILNGELSLRDAVDQNEGLELYEESFGMGEVDKVLEDVAFRLENNEVSEIVENRDGYHILKCIRTLNREETEENKKKLVELRRKEAFEAEYDELQSSLQKNLNEDMLKEIHMYRDEKIVTASFFEYCKSN